MNKIKSQKGITLIALIITIIVLLILAVVAIRAVQGDGIIGKAKEAQTKTKEAQANEQATLDGYLGKIDESQLVSKKIKDNLNKIVSTGGNITLYDDFGNKIVVPAGFKILVDETTDYAKDTIDVTKGIVIQDASGNEFVWIPVGDVYTTTDTEKTESNTTTITLGRYSWDLRTSTPTLVQPIAGDSTKSYKSEVAITSDSYTYTELQPKENGKGPNGNAIAKNINNFYEKAIASHGYYIGRYEAGVSGYDESATNNNRFLSGATNWTKYTTADGQVPQLVCKSNQQVWNDVTQNKASELCRSMYINKPYESDLINSYAWDTAIVFIQTFGANGVDGKETDSSTYASINKSTSFAKTGVNPDKYRNIYDMSGNASEWTTETFSISSIPCTERGGEYITNYGGFFYPGYRASAQTAMCGGQTFRPLLYV